MTNFDLLLEYFFWKSAEEIKELEVRLLKSSDNHPFSVLQQVNEIKDEVSENSGL